MKTCAIIIAFFIILHCPSVKAQEKGGPVTGDPQNHANQNFNADFNYRDLEPLVIRKGDFSLEIGGRIALDAIKYGYANERSSGLEFDYATLVIRDSLNH